MRITRCSPLFIALFILIALGSCSDEPEKLALPSTAERVPEQETGVSLEISQELQDVRYIQSKGGRLQWELVAKSVEQMMEGPTKLNDVRMTYYAEDGGTVVVTGDSGVYEPDTRNALLRGNVVVETSDGRRMRADVLKWDQEAGTLDGEGNVRITSGGSIIKGKRFHLLPELETFKIYQVEGIVHKEDMDL